MRLDSNQIALLNDKERERYGALERLFNTPGWKIVVAIAKHNAQAAYNAAATAKSWADNRVAVGNQAAWLGVAQMEESVASDYDSLVAQRAQETVKRAAELDEEQYE